MRRWLLPLAAATLILGGCAGLVPGDAGSSRAPDGTSRPEATRGRKDPGLSGEAQRALARRGIKPHETKALTVQSRCSHVDEIGTATRLDLNIDGGEIQAFNADVTMKGRGRCQFRLADFRQEAREPQALLRHVREPKCTVRMWWEQNDKVTVAFTGCPKACEGNAFEYLWPILVEAKTGQCF